MPTSRYESYGIKKEAETKEEVVGDNRLAQAPGRFVTSLFVDVEDQDLSTSS